MAGTATGSLKAKQTIVERYGTEFWKQIGAEGGRKGRTGGFASSFVGADGLTGRERAKEAGRIGGLKSKRTKKDV